MTKKKSTTTKRPAHRKVVNTLEAVDHPLPNTDIGTKTPVEKKPKPRIVSKDEYEAEVAAANAAQDAPGAKTPAKATTEPKKPAKAATGEPRRPSGLDAAATVLAAAKEPLNAKDLVERMLADGLWTTNGKTPAATIYAAIIREISAKGDDARFAKTDRGHFTLAAKKGA